MGAGHVPCLCLALMSMVRLQLQRAVLAQQAEVEELHMWLSVLEQPAGGRTTSAYWRKAASCKSRGNQRRHCGIADWGALSTSILCARIREWSAISNAMYCAKVSIISSTMRGQRLLLKVPDHTAAVVHKEDYTDDESENGCCSCLELV